MQVHGVDIGLNMWIRFKLEPAASYHFPLHLPLLILVPHV